MKAKQLFFYQRISTDRHSLLEEIVAKKLLPRYNNVLFDFEYKTSTGRTAGDIDVLLYNFEEEKGLINRALAVECKSGWRKDSVRHGMEQVERATPYLREMFPLAIINQLLVTNYGVARYRSRTRRWSKALV